MSGQAAGSGLLLTRALAACALLALAPLPAVSATLTVTVHKRDGRALPGAVVMLESLHPAQPPAAPVAAIMDQVNLAFVPDVLVVPVRSTVQFPNSDAVSHQVYSFSSARRFQLPLYRGKPYPPVSFEQPGVVTLGCNIHDNMLAYIVVTAAPVFGRTGSDGVFRADGAPAGRYLLRVWHPLLAEPRDVERTVEIGADDLALDVTLSRNLHPAPLTDRPHSWDY